MQKYVIENLDPEYEREVRIYKVSKEGTLNITPNYEYLDPLNNSAVVYLNPGYSVSDYNAISHAGIIEVENLNQSIVSYQADGMVETAVIDNDEMFIEVLRFGAGAEVHELTPWSYVEQPS